MSSNISNIIHILSIILPFSNETAIVLTESGYSQFKDFYKVCFDKSLLGKNSSKLQQKLKDKICTKKDYIHKILVDLLAYLGIILNIGKNTITYGYATGVVTGLLLIFYSIILPNMFLGFTTHKIMDILKLHTPLAHVAVGVTLITLLILLTLFSETVVQNLMKKIKIDPETEKNTQS
jgi:hypothetical protein